MVTEEPGPPGQYLEAASPQPLGRPARLAAAVTQWPLNSWTPDTVSRKMMALKLMIIETSTECMYIIVIH